jgi:endo-1,4-beta-xylanase
MYLKRLVTSAAIVMLGCSDAATGGADVAEFSGDLPSRPAPNEGVDTLGAQAAEGPADGTTSLSASNGAEVDEPAAGNQKPSNEAQNAEDVQITNEGANVGTPPTGSTGANSGTGQAGGGMTGGGMTGGGMPGGMTGGGQVGMGAGNGNQAPPPVLPPLNCSATPPALAGGTESCSVNASGAVDGQRWFMWYSGSGGCMTAYPGLGGAFKATWNNSGDFLARMGLQWNETQTFDTYGTVGADLAFTKTGSGGSYSFIGIYGWSNNPLVEYYIVENSFGNGPAVPYGGTQKGTFDIDGGTYKIYTVAKTNQPSIHGTANFQQFFSVRQAPRQCGHVSISGHFQKWASMGMALGKMSEARVLVEAGGGSGSISFTTANVTASGG